MNIFSEEERKKLLRRQAVLSRFGELALRSDSLDEILTEACRLIGEALDTDLAKVMELLEDGETLLVRAGVGWKPGVVGAVTIKVTDSTSEGHALKTGKAMISPNIATEKRFVYPAFLTENGVKAVANVIIIGGPDRPAFGILQIDSRRPRQFTEDDVVYLRGYANLIAAAVNRLRTINELRNGEARLRLALEAGALGSWEFDLATGVGKMSDRTLQIFGYDARQPLHRARTFLQRIVPEDRARVIETFRTATGAGTPWQVEFRIVRAGDLEPRWIQAHGRLGGGRGDASLSHVQGIVADITTRRIDEEELRQFQKMEAVGQLTGGMAHDFNNLLSIISGSLEMLELEFGATGSDDATQFISVAQGATSRAEALTHRLLAFARRQPLHPKPTNPHELVLAMHGLIKQAAGPEVKLEVKISADLWSAFVDPNQLENAILNLCANARDAMPLGGTLIVETSNVIVDKPGHHGTLPIPGEYVTVRVSDSGTGMPPDVMARAFEPFFTTKPIGFGTGLGLSMVHGFASQSGGHVNIHSEAGAGTAITIYLPRHIAAVQEEETCDPHASARSVGDGSAILVVDDIAEVRMVIARALSRLGYAITAASDAATALETLQSDTRIDLLVTDVAMPEGMSGRQLAEAAQLKRPGLQVLFITGYAETFASGVGGLRPREHVLMKPFKLNALAAKVATIIESNGVLLPA